LANQTKHSEEDLVALLRSNNQQLFGVLYDSYSKALFGVIKGIIDKDTIAEDILQESFIKIWNSRSLYDASKGRLFTWMITIARNSSVDYLRSKQNKFDENVNNKEHTVEEINKTNNVETQVDHIGLTKVIGTLKEDHRTLIDMVYFEGYTQEEISIKLDMPLGTVKTRVRSALNTLRKEIK
jgi:RNA polymerase sigma-70 factor (ECF subfamily)